MLGSFHVRCREMEVGGVYVRLRDWLSTVQCFWLELKAGLAICGLATGVWILDRVILSKAVLTPSCRPLKNQDAGGCRFNSSTLLSAILRVAPRAEVGKREYPRGALEARG